MKIGNDKDKNQAGKWGPNSLLLFFNYILRKKKIGHVCHPDKHFCTLIIDQDKLSKFNMFMVLYDFHKLE